MTAAPHTADPSPTSVGTTLAQDAPAEGRRGPDPHRHKHAVPVTEVPAPTLPGAVSRDRTARFVVLIAIGVGQALAAIGFALLTERGFNALLGGATGQAPVGGGISIPVLAAGLLVCVLLSAWLRGAERTSSEKLGQHYVTEVRARLFRHLTRVPARELGRRNRGDMLMRFVGDLSALRLWVARGLARLTVAGVAIVLALAALAVMNLALALSVGAVLLLGGLLTTAITPWMLRTAQVSRRRRSRLTGEVTERLTQVAVLQASGQEHRESRRVGRHSEKVADAMVDQARASGAARAIAEGTAVAASAAALLVGGLEVLAGRATPGTIVAGVSVAGLLAGYLRDLGRVAEYAARARVARGAVRRFLSIPPLPVLPDAPDIQIDYGLVDVRNVSLGDALTDISVRALPGQTVAVVGPNGAGKSTLTAVVARLIDPDEGSVLIDGQDVSQHSLRSVRQAVGISSPSLPLLSGSMRRNVTYRMPRVDPDELDRVSRLCGLDELAASLADGWNTNVGPGGSNLSAGQQARISIARAALGRPRLLVLDEAEAHLDSENARVVDRVLADHRGTALVVTHRDELMASTDVVWSLEDGRLVEVAEPARPVAPSRPSR
ncbi:ABC transporter ATP-binding protein [Ornithinimicrobium cavernae]|uniref:ABC transporter ATP-binding protein n=1 Tax=Ornithinimicrobium cavernae TaxID=2666047 RepID=UPI00137AB5C6|nr:ABC transporter ATP-binding protein [Ornithinimicrobium cavernae]